jgi:hypothetical protein
MMHSNMSRILEASSAPAAAQQVSALRSGSTLGRAAEAVADSVVRSIRAVGGLAMYAPFLTANLIVAIASERRKSMSRSAGAEAVVEAAIARLSQGDRSMLEKNQRLRLSVITAALVATLR